MKLSEYREVSWSVENQREEHEEEESEEQEEQVERILQETV